MPPALMPETCTASTSIHNVSSSLSSSVPRKVESSAQAAELQPVHWSQPAAVAVQVL